MKKILVNILFGLLTVCLISCNNTSLFFAAGNTVDLENPVIDVNTSTLPASVSGTVTFKGDVSDDVWVKSVDLFYVKTDVDAAGASIIKDVFLKSVGVKGKKSKWSISFDTRTLPDASTIFRFRVTDDAGKTTYKNITLELDNYGPKMIISNPIHNTQTEPISNTFLCATIPVELEVDKITKIEWTLVKSDNENVAISGVEDLISSPAKSNETYSFLIDPFPLTKLDGFATGYYHLIVSGYSVREGVSGEYGRKSQQSAISEELYFDFSSSVPLIEINNPASTDILTPTSQSTDAIVSIAVVDDDGVSYVELEWGKKDDDTDSSSDTIVLDDQPLSKTLVYEIKDLNDGVYWVRARAADIKPNLSNWTEKHYFSVDANFPTIKWNSPEQGSWHKGGTLTLNATVTIANGAEIKKITYKLDAEGSSWREAKESSEVDTSTVSHKITTSADNITFIGKILDSSAAYVKGGEAMFSIRAYKSESDYTESTMLLNFDKVVPQLACLLPDENNHYINQTIKISGTALDYVDSESKKLGIVDNINLKLSWAHGNVDVPMSDITGLSSWSYSFDTWAQGIGMNNGGEKLTITVNGTDHAGNQNQITKDVTVDQSSDIPTVSIKNFKDGEKKYGVFTVTGQAFDDDGIKRVQVYLTDNETDPIPYVIKHCQNLITGLTGETAWSNASGTENWTYPLDLSKRNNGTHRLICRSIDINDKSSTYGGVYNYVTFLVDPDIPEIDLDLDAYLNGSKSFTAVASKTASDSTDVFIKKVEYKISSTKNQQNWTEFPTNKLVYTQNKQVATVTLDYTDAMIEQFGQGDVTVSIRATDSSDKQNEASDTFFVDTVKVSATLQELNETVIREHAIQFQGGISDAEPSSGIYNDDCQIKYTYDGTQYEEAISGTELGSLSNFDKTWSIPTTLKDGVITISLEAKDKAGNGLAGDVALSGVRLCRYPPKFTTLFVNGIAASDYMSVKKDITITGSLTDNDPNDSATKGVKSIAIYLMSSANYTNYYNLNSEDVSHFTRIWSKTYDSPSESQSFEVPEYEFTTDYDYILFRAYDVAGGWADKCYKITIDTESPIAEFKYSSVGYYDGSNHKYVNRATYSDTLWISLGAKDKVKSSDSYTDLVGTYIYVGVGNGASDNDILGERIYDVGSGIVKLDLKGYTNPIYINYKVSDKAGNQTSDSIKLTRATSPTISCTLGDKWLNSTSISNVIATSLNATVLYSLLNFDSSDGQINNLALNTNMYACGSDNKIDVVKANGNVALTDETKFSITLLSTKNADGIDFYDTRNFVYDNTAPTLISLDVTEDLGATQGRVDGNRLSGVVTFSGTFSDGSLGEQESAEDFTLTASVGGVSKGTITNITKTGEVDGEGNIIFAWSWDCDTSSIAVGTGIKFKFTLKDKADNASSKEYTYDVVPCIRSITEVPGSIVGIKRFGKAYIGAEDGLCNTNYDEMYSYRLGSENIVVNGFNLSGVTYKYGSTTVTPSSSSATSATLPKGSFTVSNVLTASNNGVTSDSKTIRVFKNYTVGSNVYQSIAETDMVVKDDNMALIVFQNHYTSKSAVLRDYETEEGTFSKKSVYDNGSSNHIMRGYNRWWFISIAKDRGTASTQSYLADTKYYLLNGDTEYNNNNNAQKGTQLTGNTSGWESLLETYTSYGSDATVLAVKNDWDNAGVGGNIKYKNRWRMSAKNGEDSHDNEPKNIPAGAADWSAEWGDVCANNDQVHTVWHSQFDNNMYYRGMNNQDKKSPKYPTDGAVYFDFNGKQPSVTVDNNGKPVIICYKDTGVSSSSGLYVYYSSVAQPTSTTWSTNFTEKCVGQGIGVGMYPRIEIESNGHVHIFYQDAGEAALMYVYADSLSALSTSSSRVVIDTDCAPGYYNDIRVVDGIPVCTYLAYGLLGSGNAVRVARYEGSTFTGAAYTTRDNWEVVTMPCAHPIAENKVRGYVIKGSSTAQNWLFGFAKSSTYGPEFFREKK